MRSSLLSLALGYGPAIVLGLVAAIWFHAPVWLAALAVLLGGPILTLVIAALRSAPDFRRRMSWRRSDDVERQGPPGRPRDQGNSR